MARMRQELLILEEEEELRREEERKVRAFTFVICYTFKHFNF